MSILPCHPVPQLHTEDVLEAVEAAVEVAVLEAVEAVEEPFSAA